ncbi:hypothetical protein M422DRAFT_275307 [Sphaerobolus stellatus SS14]|uniref:Uncharacterized protein n=1 Tax=Sphaerobolus stellatus (strain SS14) TaxID=990650 RepID=A0A0C9TQ05_SPHS4|nr:hypothetical protein M422DRAFT_275307 [Sphaerobolus stellatus SS14]
MDTHLVTGRRKNLIAIPCFACPEPEFNMEVNWCTITPKELSYVNRLHISQDANFRNQMRRKEKKSDPDDIAFFNGRCFYDLKQAIDTYLLGTADSDAKSECSNHKAVALQNILKFVHMVITGIMVVVCRHDLFRVGGHIDLQRGECYMNADFALHGALTWIPSPDEITHTYDIVCQYSKKIRARWEKHFPEEIGLLDRMIHAVLKKHIVGHIQECQVRYSCDYKEGFGRVYGEGVEAMWAEDNQQSSGLREMNQGMRQDVTENNHMFWNS